MSIIKQFIDIMLNLDIYLGTMITNYGFWTYLILFLIICCETGLVVMPFLPGDSILFAAGAFAALGSFNIYLLILVLGIAAILGDTINYHIGKSMGSKIYEKDNLRFIKKEYLIKTHEFYEKHGGKTIIIARFMPIIRTFAPFVAGVGNMSYWRFISFNAIGGMLWVVICSVAGYFFGNIPFVKDNFSLVIFAIIFISILPGIIGMVKHKVRLKSEKEERVI